MNHTQSRQRKCMNRGTSLFCRYKSLYGKGGAQALSVRLVRPNPALDI